MTRPKGGGRRMISSSSSRDGPRSTCSGSDSGPGVQLAAFLRGRVKAGEGEGSVTQ